MPASLLEQVEKKESDYAIALELLKEFQLIVDSIEQPRERPSDNQEQQEYRIFIRVVNLAMLKSVGLGERINYYPDQIGGESTMKSVYLDLTIRNWQKRDRAAAASVIQQVLQEYGLSWEPTGADLDVVAVETAYLNRLLAFIQGTGNREQGTERRIEA